MIKRQIKRNTSGFYVILQHLRTCCTVPVMAMREPTDIPPAPKANPPPPVKAPVRVCAYAPPDASTSTSDEALRRKDSTWAAKSS
jgi:hypothetical protein